jgi:hypothetical protein
MTLRVTATGAAEREKRTMSSYLYGIIPETIDLIDDLGYEESELEQMHPETIYELACKALSEPRIRRL